MNAPLSFDTDEEWDITLSINSILPHTAQHNSQSSPSSSIPHDNQIPELDMTDYPWKRTWNQSSSGSSIHALSPRISTDSLFEPFELQSGCDTMSRLPSETTFSSSIISEASINFHAQEHHNNVSVDSAFNASTTDTPRYSITPDENNTVPRTPAKFVDEAITALQNLTFEKNVVFDNAAFNDCNEEVSENFEKKNAVELLEVYNLQFKLSTLVSEVERAKRNFEEQKKENEILKRYQENLSMTTGEGFWKYN